jgi:hypothetical protein
MDAPERCVNPGAPRRPEADRVLIRRPAVSATAARSADVVLHVPEKDGNRRAPTRRTADTDRTSAAGLRSPAGMRPLETALRGKPPHVRELLRLLGRQADDTGLAAYATAALNGVAARREQQLALAARFADRARRA